MRLEFRCVNVREAYLGGGLGQAHDGLPLWRAGHRAQIQVVGFQLRDRGEKGRAGQGGSREMGRGSVHLLVAPEIQGDLLTDGGCPGTPLMLNGYQGQQDRSTSGSPLK